MTRDTTKAGQAATETARRQAEERQRRSALALRANLRRRKAQQQAQLDEHARESEEPPTELP